MKQYVIAPTMKKSVVEVRTFKKEINGINHYLRYEDCYRWGGFVLNVPETPEEYDSWAKHCGYSSFSEWCVDYEFDPEKDDIKDYTLPSSNEDPVMIMEDWGWEAEMIDLWDGGCWTEWTISAYGDGALTEEERVEEAEALSEIYYEEYEEGLEKSGWEESDTDWLIYNDFELIEVGENESPYDVYNARFG